MHLLLASLLGLAAGCLAGGIWRSLSRRWAATDFWQQLSVVARSLLSTDDDANFLAAYLRLLPKLGHYLLTRMGLVAISAAPVVAAYSLWLGLAPAELAQELQVFPPMAATFRVANADPVQFDARGRTAARAQELSPGCLTVGEARWRIVDSHDRHFATKSLIARLALLGLGFSEMQLASGTPPSKTIVLRTGAGDVNPLWPWLADGEALFLLLTCVGSVGVLVWPSRVPA